jgi:hypothetical protein
MMMVMRDDGLVAPSSDFCLAAPCKDVTHLSTFDLENSNLLVIACGEYFLKFPYLTLIRGKTHMQKDR